MLSSKQATAKIITVHDPLLDAIPDIGTEGLIATVKDKDELFQKLNETKVRERAIISGRGR